MMHLDDALLARLLDSELTARERSEWETHLRQCLRCRHALEELRWDAQRVTGLLVKADTSAPSMQLPDRRWGSRWTRKSTAIAAAAAGLLLVVSISPTRAWISQSLDHVRDLLLDRRTAPATDDGRPSSQRTEPNAVRVSIPLSTDVLSIQVAARQQSGTITVTTVDENGSSAEIVDGGPEELVVADGLRILNVSESTSSYLITVPVTVSAVVLHIGGEGARRYDIDRVGQSWVVELSQ